MELVKTTRREQPRRIPGEEVLQHFLRTGVDGCRWRRRLTRGVTHEPGALLITGQSHPHFMREEVPRFSSSAVSESG